MDSELFKLDGRPALGKAFGFFRQTAPSFLHFIF